MNGKRYYQSSIEWKVTKKLLSQGKVDEKVVRNKKRSEWKVNCKKKSFWRSWRKIVEKIEE